MSLATSSSTPLPPKNPRELWSPIIEEITIGLRPALDQLAWELSERNIGKAPPDPIPRQWTKISFPIVRKSKGWDPDPIWAIEPAPVARTEALQPYVTGMSAPEREPLAVLDELCSIDIL